jgi:hypothetical protein
MEVVKSYSLYFNTREADYGDSNNCTFIFTTPLVLTNNQNRFRVSTPMVEIPYSFSQLNANNNIVNFTYSDTAPIPRTNIALTFTIPEGNYNILQLIIIFIQLTVASINANGVINGAIDPNNVTVSNFSITYNPQTSETTWKLIYTPSTFAYTWTVTYDFTFAFVIGTMFGWRITDIVTITDIPQTTPNKVMVNPITSIYIRSESLKFESNYEAIVRNSTTLSTNRNNYQNSDVLTKIPITTLPNSIIYFRSDYKSIISNKELGELNLYVSDNLSPAFNLDLQGLNYGIYILLEEVMIPKQNQFQDKIELQQLIQTQLIDERQKLMEDLIKEKQELENEIKINNIIDM